MLSLGPSLLHEMLSMPQISVHHTSPLYVPRCRERSAAVGWTLAASGKLDPRMCRAIRRRRARLVVSLPRASIGGDIRVTRHRLQKGVSESPRAQKWRGFLKAQQTSKIPPSRCSPRPATLARCRRRRMIRRSPIWFALQSASIYNGDGNLAIRRSDELCGSDPTIALSL